MSSLVDGCSFVVTFMDALIHLLGFKIYGIILNVTLLHFSLERDLFWKTLMLF